MVLNVMCYFFETRCICFISMSMIIFFISIAVIR